MKWPFEESRNDDTCVTPDDVHEEGEHAERWAGGDTRAARERPSRWGTERAGERGASVTTDVCVSE